MQQNQVKRSSSPSNYNSSIICCDTIKDQDKSFQIMQALQKLNSQKNKILATQCKFRILNIKQQQEQEQNLQKQKKKLNDNNQCNITELLQKRIEYLDEKLKKIETTTRENIRKQYEQSLKTQQEKVLNLQKQIKILSTNIKEKGQHVLSLQKIKDDSSLLMKRIDKVVSNIQERIIKKSQLIRNKYKSIQIDRTQLNIVKKSVNEKIFKNQVENLEKLLKLFEFIIYELQQSSSKDARIKQIQKENEDLKKNLKVKQEQIIQRDKDVSQFDQIINRQCLHTNQWGKTNLKQLAKMNQASKLKKTLKSFQEFRQKSYKNYQFQKNRSISFQKTINKLEKEKHKLKEEKDKLKEEKDKLEEEKDKLEKQITKLQNLLKQKQQQINTLKKDKKQQAQKYQKEVKKLKFQKDKEIEKLEEQKFEEINLIKQDMRRKEQNYIEKIKKSQNIIVELEKCKYQKERYCKILQQEKSQLQQKIKLERQKRKEQDKLFKNKVQEEHETINRQLKQKQDQNKILNEEISKVRFQYDQLFKKNDNLMQDYEKAKNQIKDLHQKNYRTQSQLFNFFKEISSVQYQLSNIKQEVSKENIQSVISQIKYQIFNLLNSSPVLSESAILDYRKDKGQINFIKNSVQVFKKAKISGCQLVYRKDQQKSNVNFHAYIDGVQNLLLIIHLANNRVIGGFTSKPFIKNNTQNHTQGFLYVADTQTVYFMKPQAKKAITYDEYYIIWGNSQIRIRFGEDNVFSNFGILNSFYDNKKAKIQDFLGFGNQREINMNTFEFYKIKF